MRYLCAFLLVLSGGLGPALEAAAAQARPQAPELAGDWQGTLEAGPVKLRLVVHLTCAADGTLSGTMDSVDQGASGLPFTSVTLTGRKIEMLMPRVDGSFEGTLNDAGDQMAGEWKQAGNTLPLVLRKGGQLPERKRRPQDPVKPYPYDEKEVVVENKAGGVRLAGTLTVPKNGEPPYPAVVLITGSGPQNRDEELLNHRPFLVLADYLTRQGIAVLRMDDRGVGGSTGSNDNSTSADFAGDILAAVEFLKDRDEVDSNAIGLIGHSEGGMIAPMVAVSSPSVSFIVLLAGPGQRGDRLLEQQMRDLAASQGLTPDQIEGQVAMQRKALEVLRHESDLAAAKEKMRAIFKEAAAKLSSEERARIGLADAAIDGQVNRTVTPWFRYYVSYDPLPVLRKVSVPVLALNGDKDVQVNAKVNLPLIEAALREGGNTEVTVMRLAGLNHLFQTCRKCTVAEYGELDETMSPVALKAIGEWIAARTQ